MRVPLSIQSPTPDRNLLDVLGMDSYCAMVGNKFVSIGYSIDLNCSRFTYQYIFSGGDDDHDNAQLLYVDCPTMH